MDMQSVRSPQAIFIGLLVAILGGGYLGLSDISREVVKREGLRLYRDMRPEESTPAPVTPKKQAPSTPRAMSTKKTEPDLMTFLNYWLGLGWLQNATPP